MTMNTHELTIKIKVTDEQINDIVDSAFRGKRYWSTEDYVKNDEQVPQDVLYNEVLTHGFKYRIQDTEDEKWYTLTLKTFLKGLEMTPEFNYENYDQYDAERVLQKALFGKVIYG